MERSLSRPLCESHPVSRITHQLISGSFQVVLVSVVMMGRRPLALDLYLSHPRDGISPSDSMLTTIRESDRAFVSPRSRKLSSSVRSGSYGRPKETRSVDRCESVKLIAKRQFCSCAHPPAAFVRRVFYFDIELQQFLSQLVCPLPVSRIASGRSFCH